MLYNFLLVSFDKTKDGDEIFPFRYKLGSSDSIVEHRVLDTREFCLHFEYSKFRVIGPSNRVLLFMIICYFTLRKHILKAGASD
jgi:hypothetical protein